MCRTDDEEHDELTDHTANEYIDGSYCLSCGCNTLIRDGSSLSCDNCGWHSGKEPVI